MKTIDTQGKQSTFAIVCLFCRGQSNFVKLDAPANRISSASIRGEVGGKVGEGDVMVGIDRSYCAPKCRPGRVGRASRDHRRRRIDAGGRCLGLLQVEIIRPS